MDLGLIHIDQPSGDDDIVNIPPAGFGKDRGDVKANMSGGNNFFSRFYIRHVQSFLKKSLAKTAAFSCASGAKPTSNTIITALRF